MVDVGAQRDGRRDGRTDAAPELTLFVSVADDSLRSILIEAAYGRGIRVFVSSELGTLGEPNGALVVADARALAVVDAAWRQTASFIVGVGSPMPVLAAAQEAALAPSLLDLLREVERLLTTPPKLAARRQSGEILSIPPIQLDLFARQVWVHERLVAVRRAEFNVLHYLMGTLECNAHGGRQVQLTSAGSSDPDGDLDRFHWVRNDQIVEFGPTTTVFFGLGTSEVALNAFDIATGCKPLDRLNVEAQIIDTASTGVLRVEPSAPLTKAAVLELAVRAP